MTVSRLRSGTLPRSLPRATSSSWKKCLPVRVQDVPCFGHLMFPRDKTQVVHCEQDVDGIGAWRAVSGGTWGRSGPLLGTRVLHVNRRSPFAIRNYRLGDTVRLSRSCFSYFCLLILVPAGDSATRHLLWHLQNGDFSSSAIPSAVMARILIISINSRIGEEEPSFLPYLFIYVSVAHGFFILWVTTHSFHDGPRGGLAGWPPASLGYARHLLAPQQNA